MSVLQEYCNTGDTTQFVVFGINWRGQTFTPTVSHKITSVKLKLYRKGLPEIVAVSIRATDGSGLPTGTDLCSGSFVASVEPLLPTGSPYEWREISLGSGYQLSASVKYAIVLRATTGSSSKCIYWRIRTTSGYAGGNYVSSNNSGSTWTATSTSDTMFEEWGELGATGGKILLEDGGGLLQEDGFYLLQESGGGAAYLRLILSNLTLAATIGRSRNKHKDITSAITLSATINRVFGRKRTIASAITVAATISRGFKKIINSNLTLAATIGKKVEFHRTIESALNLYATISTGAKHAYLEVINSAITLAATISHKVGYHKAVNSSLTLSATVGKKAEFHRTIASALTLAATLTFLKGFNRTVSSALTLSATIARKATYKRTISSSLTLAATIVIEEVKKLVNIIVVAGNVYAVKVIDGGSYGIKTVAGNIFSMETIEGVIDTVKEVAGKIYDILNRE